MNCKQAKLELALLAGHDLDGASEQQVRRHLAECPCCRDHWQALEGSLAVLQQVAAAEDVRETKPVRGAAQGEPSLWPALAARIDARPARLPAPQFPRWVPATAVAAACIALAVYIQQPRSEGTLFPFEPSGGARMHRAGDFAELPEHDPLLDLIEEFHRNRFAPPDVEELEHLRFQRLQRSVQNSDF